MRNPPQQARLDERTWWITPPANPPYELLISNGNFRRSAVRSVSVTIGVYRSIFPAGRPTKRHRASQKKTVTRPRITRARRDTDIEPVEHAWPMPAICY